LHGLNGLTRIRCEVVIANPKGEAIQRRTILLDCSRHFALAMTASLPPVIATTNGSIPFNRGLRGFTRITHTHSRAPRHCERSEAIQGVMPVWIAHVASLSQ
jgi:hypothetical protein